MRYLDQRSHLPIDVDDMLGQLGIVGPDARHREAMDLHLQTACSVIETACARPIDVRRARFEVRGPCPARWWFPVIPVEAVETVEVTDDHRDWRVLGDAAWKLALSHEEPQLMFDLAQARGAAGLRVTATVGHGIDDVPLPITAAVRLLAREYFEADNALGDMPEMKLTMGVERLIRQCRYVRPRERA